MTAAKLRDNYIILSDAACLSLLSGRKAFVPACGPKNELQ
jgi:hypothetical protein